MNTQIRDVLVVPEGDGVDVKRLFPLPEFMNFDPFVLWDHFNITPGRGFPDHPHRGFEAITYMFEGGMNHKDNLGNESFVKSGGAQRFTAGSGLVHSEMPDETANSNGIQLWINLPKKLKKISPSYQQVNADEFPVKKFDGGQVKILLGEGSELKLNTQVIYQHVILNENKKYQLDIDLAMRGIVYLLSGQLKINQTPLKSNQAMFIENTSKLMIEAAEKSEFMLCFGMPHNQPIYQHGPFVD